MIEAAIYFVNFEWNDFEQGEGEAGLHISQMLRGDGLEVVVIAGVVVVKLASSTDHEETAITGKLADKTKGIPQPKAFQSEHCSLMMKK